MRGIAIAVTVALLAVIGAGGAGAQPRPCLDLSGDRSVDFADVTGGHRVAALLDATVDPRPDFDFERGVTVTDVVNGFLVASGRKPALIDFQPRAAAAGELVKASVQNVPADARQVRVLLTAASGEVEADDVAVSGSAIEFRLPDLGSPGVLDRPGLEQALPGVDRRGLVLVRAVVDGRSSNVCPLLVLAAGERDGDGDGLRDAVDTCPAVADPQNGDTDADGLGDYCDNCPATPNRDQRDSNGDGSGDACEPPRAASINGVALAPPRGVDGRMQQIEAEKPHGILILTREIDMAIEHRLGELGVALQQPLARHVFVVAAERRAFAALADFAWFHALVPLTPQIRLVGELRGSRPPGPNEVLTLDVQFHDDVPLDRARGLLRQLGAAILVEGIDLGDEYGKFQRRVNQWQVRLPGRALLALAELDAVLTIERHYENKTDNANSRAAIRVDVVNTGGLNGAGVTLGEWDGGWADGDAAAPPVAPSGGVHPGFGGRVRVRDHAGGPETVPYPGTCTATQIACGANCNFANHPTHVAGTMIGDGSLVPTGSAGDRGMANMAQLISYEWPNSGTELVCERQDSITNFGTLAHNHSWSSCVGCTSTLGFYNAFTAALDQDIRIRPGTTVFFSSSNDQNYRNSLFNPCTGATDPPCALPAIYTAPTCTAVPAGVTPPPALPVPPTNVVNRFYTVESPGATAKSTVAVGSLDGTTGTTNRLSNFSSMGPTLDGRLKPEVVALGGSVTSTCVPGLADGVGTCGASGYLTIGGTSMATPAVTGASALLYERATALAIPIFGSSEVRALVAHTATDLDVHPAGAFLGFSGQWGTFGTGADGPDFLTGYGRVDAVAARDRLNGGNIGGTLQPSGCPTSLNFPSIPFQSPVAVGGAGPVAGCPAMVWDVVWYVTIPAATTRMKVTIAWNDVQATSGANPTLVNDIDLMVASPSGTYFYPWRLDPACPYLQAVRVQASAFDNLTYGDHRNTIEQVDIATPLAAGVWKIIVRTDGLASGPQPFSMVVSLN